MSGADPRSLNRIREFYSGLVQQVVAVSSVRTAELTKLFENTFRHFNIALVNELAIAAGQLGVDVREAINAAATKPFGFMPFAPGPGVGGHCLPIDPSYLSWQVKRTVGHRFRFIELANDINESMPQYVVQRLVLGLNNRQKPVKGSRLLLLGLAYKKNVGDLREPPAAVGAELLHQLGADLRVVEPHADARQCPHNVSLVDLTEAELAAAAAVEILADHDAFDYEKIQLHAGYVFDTRARCSGSNVEQLCRPQATASGSSSRTGPEPASPSLSAKLCSPQLRRDRQPQPMQSVSWSRIRCISAICWSSRCRQTSESRSQSAFVGVRSSGSDASAARISSSGTPTCAAIRMNAMRRSSLRR